MDMEKNLIINIDYYLKDIMKMVKEVLVKNIIEKVL